MLILIYLCSLITYFLSIRTLLIKDAFDYINGGTATCIVLLGLIPVFNIIGMIFMLISYLVATNNYSAEDILRKMLFVKSKKTNN
jgi:hypothetical protein